VALTTSVTLPSTSWKIDCSVSDASARIDARFFFAVCAFFFDCSARS
jgi:hypothetical protein